MTYSENMSVFALCKHLFCIPKTYVMTEYFVKYARADWSEQSVLYISKLETYG